MARYITSVRTALPAAEAFDFMADMRNFTKWDPGVRHVDQIEGSGGGPRSVFDVTIAGRRELVLRYETMDYEAPRELLLRAESRMLISLDRITIREEDGSTVVTYDAELTLNGPMRFADLLLRPAFRRIGDRAADGLLRALEGEPVGR